MIKTVQNCFANTWNSVCATTQQVKNALNETIKLIARYNLKLIAVSLACAYFHDYNVILIYGFIGLVFHQQIDDLTKTVKAIFEAAFIIITPPLKVLRDYKAFNIRIFNRPVKTILAAGSIFTFLLLQPVSSIAAEFFCIVNCGANIAKTSIEIVKEHQEREKQDKES